MISSSASYFALSHGTISLSLYSNPNVNAGYDIASDRMPLPGYIVSRMISWTKLGDLLPHQPNMDVR